MSMSNDVKDPQGNSFWVSTISIASLPYKFAQGWTHETCVFDGMGKTVHFVRTKNEEEAALAHKVPVTNIPAGTFTPNGMTYADWNVQEDAVKEVTDIQVNKLKDLLGGLFE